MASPACRDSKKRLAALVLPSCGRNSVRAELVGGCLYFGGPRRTRPFSSEGSRAPLALWLSLPPSAGVDTDRLKAGSCDRLTSKLRPSKGRPSHVLSEKLRPLERPESCDTARSGVMRAFSQEIYLHPTAASRAHRLRAKG